MREGERWRKGREKEEGGMNNGRERCYTGWRKQKEERCNKGRHRGREE